MAGELALHGGRSARLLTLAWSGFESASRQVLSLVFFFVSVRFLQPADLGLFALALAFSCIAGIVIDEPIGESLVQKAQITAVDWNTGFTLNLYVALVFVGLSAAAAWPLAWALGEPALLPVLPVLACSALLGALGNIQKAYLARALRFRRIAQTTLAAQVAGGVVSVALAAAGFGYWALVANLLVAAGISSAIYYTICPWKPRLMIDRSAIASRLAYALYSVALRSIYLLRDQAPLIIAGLSVDLAQLGLLSLALRVARSASALFEEVTGRPLLSLMSREQHDAGQFVQVLLEVLTIVGLLAVPAYVGLAMLGPRLVPLVFGAEWAAAGAYLPAICVVLGGWLVLQIIAVSLRARELGRIAVLVTAPAALADVVILAVLMPFGLRWALAGWAMRAVLTLPVAARVFGGRLGMPLGVVARRLAPPVLASALMAAALAALGQVAALPGGWAGTAASVLVGGAVYAASLAALAPRLRRRMVSALAGAAP